MRARQESDVNEQSWAETDISRAILEAYHNKLSSAITSDVLIVGAGPSGLLASYYLAQNGLKVTVLEKRLSPGGGIWGGGMAMNQIVIQADALPLVDEFGIRHEAGHKGLHIVDALELAAGLCFKAVQAGVFIANLVSAEDLCVHNGRVTGVVVNRSLVGESLPIDPITLSARAVIDATGHEASVVQALHRRGLLAKSAAGDAICEGPMDAASGETFVEEQVAEVYPGLWVTGMSVCATFHGPRMGPIFGGMLLSGKRVANLVADTL